MKIDLRHFYDIINPVYWNFFEDNNRIRLLYGGAGSGKSYYAFQEMIYKVLTQKRQNFLIIRKVSRTHRTSTFSLAQQIINKLNFSILFKLNKTDLTITCKHNGNMIIFLGMDDPEKIKSVTAINGVITSIIVEEATELTFDDINQLNIRLRGESLLPFQLTLVFNPISVNHFLYKEFFQKKSFQKENAVTILKTTYKDNKFIDKDYKAVLEGYKHIDEQYYKIYCLGEFGIIGNIIFYNYSLDVCPYKEEDFDALYNGMDFGFIHPALIEKIGFKDGIMYSYDELCDFEKTNIEFINANIEFNVLKKNEVCRADSAEPDRIKEWVQHGFGIIPAIKGPGSVGRGIDFLKSQIWIIDPIKCPRLVQELEQYHYKLDKNGEATEDPVEIYDDGIKSCMYALEPLSKNKGKPVVLSGSKSEEKKKLIKIKHEERRKMREVLKAQAREKRLQKK